MVKLWVKLGIFNKLSEWFCNVLASWIIAILDTIKSILIDSFSEDGLAFNYLNQSPTDFSVSGASNTSLWKIIEEIVNDTVIPLGFIILAIAITYDLIQMVLKGNNFKDFDDSIFIKWIIRSVCSIILVSNATSIAGSIYGIGTWATSNVLSSLQSFSDNNQAFQVTAEELAEKNGWGLFIPLLIGILCLIVAVVMSATIIIVICSRIIEIYMNMSVAPICMATFMLDGEVSGIGKNWIKSTIALAMQGFFIVVVLCISTAMLSQIYSSFENGGNITKDMIKLFGFMLAMIFTMFRTSNISKSVFNAH